MKIRKYFRGSGRVLAFVFIASVLWLLFDMAALRFSMSDTSSVVLKQRVVEERLILKSQTTKRTLARHGGFKHPVQRVDNEGKDNVQLLNKVAQAYRRQQKEQEKLGRNKSAVESVVLKQKKKDVPGNFSLSPKQNLPKQAKKAVDLDEPSPVEPGKVAPNSLINVTDAVFLTKGPKLHPGIQEDKHALLPTAQKESHNGGNAGDTHGDSRADRPVKEDLKDKNAKQDNEVRLDIAKKDDDDDDDDSKNEDKPVNVISNATRDGEEPPGPRQGSDVGAKPGRLDRKSGFHKVHSLDVTGAPRDPQAVGQYGHVATVPSDQAEEAHRKWGEGEFNVFLSDQIPLDRAIPDTRPQGCSESIVHDDLPSTSVIFCFVDEVWSTLLRSVHSVLNRSPAHLLEEIILVDDCSTRDYLGEQLDEYMKKLPKVRIVRLKERQGLIRARLEGAAIAKGEVLTFLDSHVECNVGWLEPLLERVYLDRRKVACPVIEVIKDKDMSYMLVENFQRGIFKWPLVFGWNTLSEEYIKQRNLTVADPIRCPVMAGGLFSIDKKYFYELGAYDRGLDVWGGENMEISFKIWMCGGEIEIIPCSRVGHIFRGQNPYKFPKNRQKTIERNLARVAEVWLDEYKELFYGHGYHHLLDRNAVDVGDLAEQVALRQKLRCKSFQWYLDNVYSDVETHLVQAEGLMFNHGLRKCLALHEGALSFTVCDLNEKSQHFNHSWTRHLRQQNVCISVQEDRPTRVEVQPCDSYKGVQHWSHKYVNSVGHLISESSTQNLCLEASLDSPPVRLSHCDSHQKLQNWQFTQNYIKGSLTG